jgi:Tfp pilus assembly protein PilF
MLPVVLLAYALLAAPASGDVRRRSILLCVPMLLIVTAAVLVRVWLLLKVEYASPGLDLRLVIVALDAIRGYLHLLLWPTGQTIFHSLTAPDRLMDPQVGLSCGVLLFGAVAAWLMRKVDRLVPFGVVWFVLFLIPSSALFVLGRGEALAEHRVYLSSIGIFLGVAVVLRLLVSRVAIDAPALRTVLLALAVVFVLQLSARTLLRNAMWADPVRLWRESIAKAPDHWLPHLMLAEALRQMQGCAAGESEYRKSIQLRPEAAFAYTKLGGCLIEQRRLAEASAVFGELTRTAPQSAEGPSGLALVAMMEHGPDSARPYLLEAIRRDASAVSPRQILAGLDERRDPAAALRLCQEIRALAPMTPGNEECIRRNQQRLDSSHPAGH